VDSQTP